MKEKTLWIVLGLLGAAAVAYVAYTMSKQEPPPPANEEEGIYCTQDAKQCPDGSYVGRVPPSCEFAPCPGPAVEVEVR